MPITSADLAALLNDKVINDAFMIARSNRTGILSTVSIGGPRQAYDGYKMGWLDMRVDATSSTTTAQALAAATTIAVADGTKFRAGMTASPAGSDEVVLITAVSGNTGFGDRFYGVPDVGRAHGAGARGLLHGTVSVGGA